MFVFTLNKQKCRKGLKGLSYCNKRNTNMHFCMFVKMHVFTNMQKAFWLFHKPKSLFIMQKQSQLHVYKPKHLLHTFSKRKTVGHVNIVFCRCCNK